MYQLRTSSLILSTFKCTNYVHLENLPHSLIPPHSSWGVRGGSIVWSITLSISVGNSNRLFHHVYDRITGKYDCILIQVREIPTGGGEWLHLIFYSVLAVNWPILTSKGLRRRFEMSSNHHMWLTNLSPLSLLWFSLMCGKYADQHPLILSTAMLTGHHKCGPWSGPSFPHTGQCIHKEHERLFTPTRR